MAAFDDLISQLASRDPDQEAALDQYLAQLQAPAQAAPATAPAMPPAAPQAVDTETAPIVAPSPTPGPGAAPGGRPLLPPRKLADRTVGENIGLVGTSMADAFANAANRLGNRPQGPSNMAGAYRAQVAQNVANRQATMDRGRQQDIQTMFQSAAEGRALQKQQAEAAMRDPNSPQSEAAWRAVQFRRQESGLEPLPEEMRKSFTAADAEGFVKNAPQAFTAMQQRQQANETAIRKQAEQATSAQEQLAVLKALNVPIGDISTDDPAAVKLAYETAMKNKGWEEALKRARVTAAGMSGGGGTASIRREGMRTPSELMAQPDAIQDALTDIDQKMASLGTSKEEDAYYKRLEGERKKLVEMDQYRLPGMRFTKTPTKNGFDQATELTQIKNELERIQRAAEEANISGLPETVKANLGQYAAMAPEALQQAFPDLKEAATLGKRLKRLQQVVAGSILLEKDEKKLGAIAGPDMNLILDYLGNPTGFIELASGQGIEGLSNAVNTVNASYPEKMEQYGYAPQEGAGAQAQPRSPQPQAQQQQAPQPSDNPALRQELEGLSDEELMRIAGEGG